MSYVLSVPGRPPSVNATKQHWRLRHRASKDWYAKVAGYALTQRIPRPAFASAVVEIEIRYKGRKVDADNYAKILCDSLVRCGILADDSFPALSELRLRARPAGADAVVMTVSPVFPDPELRG